MHEIKYQVFISSTYEDLRHEREEVIKTILIMGHIPIGMEMFKASDETSWDIIKRKIDETDYFALIIAHKYGAIFGPDGKSFTEKEYDYAIEKNIPVLAFLIDPQTPWPPQNIETNAATKLDVFKNKVLQKNVNRWKDSKDLSSQVALSLQEQFNVKPRPGWVRGDQIPSLKMVTELAQNVLQLKQKPSHKEPIESQSPEGPSKFIAESAELIIESDGCKLSVAVFILPPNKKDITFRLKDFSVIAGGGFFSESYYGTASSFETTTPSTATIEGKQATLRGPGYLHVMFNFKPNSKLLEAAESSGEYKFKLRSLTVHGHESTAGLKFVKSKKANTWIAVS